MIYKSVFLKKKVKETLKTTDRNYNTEFVKCRKQNQKFTNPCWSQSSLWARHHKSPHLDLKQMVTLISHHNAGVAHTTNRMQCGG